LTKSIQISEAGHEVCILMTVAFWARTMAGAATAVAAAPAVTAPRFRKLRRDIAELVWVVSDIALLQQGFCFLLWLNDEIIRKLRRIDGQGHPKIIGNTPDLFKFQSIWS
jgi:hypothetical protein